MTISLADLERAAMRRAKTPLYVIQHMIRCPVCDEPFTHDQPCYIAERGGTFVTRNRYVVWHVECHRSDRRPVSISDQRQQEAIDRIIGNWKKRLGA